MADWNRDMAQAPRDGTAILVWDGKDIVTARWDEEDGWGYWRLVQASYTYPIDDHVHQKPQAWQPLPEPPGDE